MPGGPATRGAKGIRLPMQRTITLLHQPVAACAKQRSIHMENCAPYWNPTLGKTDAGLFNRYRQHLVRISNFRHGRSIARAL